MRGRRSSLPSPDEPPLLQIEFEELYSPYLSALFSLHTRRSYGGENIGGIGLGFFFSKISLCSGFRFCCYLVRSCCACKYSLNVADLKIVGAICGLKKTEWQLEKNNTSEIFLFKINRGAKVAEAALNIYVVYEENAIGESTARKWFCRFNTQHSVQNYSAERGSLSQRFRDRYPAPEQFFLWELFKSASQGDIPESQICTARSVYKWRTGDVLEGGQKAWVDITARLEKPTYYGRNDHDFKIKCRKQKTDVGERLKLHNAELHALYSSPDIIRNTKFRRLRWAGHVAGMSESRNAYSVLAWRPEEKGPLGLPRRRWEDNIKMDLREVGYDDRDWINVAQDRDRWRAYVRAAMNLRSLMLAGNEFQSLGRAIVKEDEYEEVRWDGIVSIVSWRERVFRLWWEERLYQGQCRHLFLGKSQYFRVCAHLTIYEVLHKSYVYKNPSMNTSYELICRRNVRFYLTTLATAEVISASPDVPEFCPEGVLLHASKSTDMSLSHLSTLKCHRPGPGSNSQPWA
ncbi:hypothetical protein ANN_12472 [Periplaneta americana]|uniref:Mos1 transposase HTH domain-containing protein n=1 Tax=Periplaneta americana TaxID=6978 RepID=A0ABQ8TJ59_PERAM|nr:hypothetical protein ANN_12472 [Periplaneta americana]